MDPPFDNTRHIRYWQRCLRSLLPHQYTSNDSTRMTLGCFIVAAIDLLLPPGSPSIISPTDKQKLRDWVLACQHPCGGFAGGPTHAHSSSEYDGFDFITGQPVAGTHSAANLAATLFALQLLALLSDDTDINEGVAAESAFIGVNRAATLSWLSQLQRKDGSFGEVLVDVVDLEAPDGRRLVIAGGSDTRYCYIASMIRWMLRGQTQKGDGEWVKDIDVDALVRYIRKGQTYDGGFSESSMHESHAGYAFCAIAALSLLDRPQEKASKTSSDIFDRDIPDKPAFIHWLASRQVLPSSPCSQDEDEVEDEVQGTAESEEVAAIAQPAGGHPRYIGFNGRSNKPADTCYTWWTMGTLANLHQGTIDDREVIEPSRRFLLEKMQHVIGGFSKCPGGPPDLYHSYLGLAALATMGEPSLKSFDPVLCISSDTVKKIEVARQRLLSGAGKYGQERRQSYLDMGKACWENATSIR
ncbi:geranylgeranyl transferase type 1 beta subunit [Grosmannia clavigera kw1407]|uniref:Geranylgeranyl transferase type 1 beta subunit n=1 Tax=Grosmannia clavigera (strain kw1407 / UAMH 11150) TaxID=655863 RepID=F0XQZ3_GROCL|nr:geranylgeranyl transferase type 1 beta subunit [Grosmannia clavigera kw1407]EFW99891.1 geranylgeranyl transferase type 1 beta subunit [Grosmannia clavigera kw1407]